MRAGFGNNNVDTCARVCHSPTGYGLKQTLGESAGTQDFASVLKADVIVVGLLANAVGILVLIGNRIGHGVMSVGQLKILQEVITLSIFVPFSVLYLKEKLTLDYLWAGLCLLGAVFFLFRKKIMGA